MDRGAAIASGLSRHQQHVLNDPDPQILADNILYAINQPLGVDVGDITVRCSNDMFII